MLDQRQSVKQLEIDCSIALDDAWSVVLGKACIVLAPAARNRMAAAHGRLSDAVEMQRHVYGITTGFGPLANRLVPTSDMALLQQNLVYHLASGVGPAFSWVEARAIVFARLMAILQGASGASPAAVDTLVRVMNSEFAPRIPQQGTVGASGDLTPLAHMVLALQAEGDFILRDETRIGGSEALNSMGLRPLSLHNRDALALVNGTSAMTGMALVAWARAGRVSDWSVALTAALADVLLARLEAWNPAFAALRPHPGQIWATDALMARAKSAGGFIRTPISERILTELDAPMSEERAGQDAYTLRCAPQVIGAVKDTCLWHRSVLETELASVTDNPVFPEAVEGALHGGNFMGQHIGLVSDALSLGVGVLAGFHERQVARLTDETMNRGLPPFLQKGTPGLNSGFMGAQVTATALTAEIRSVGPASIHSISTNGANQDVVSMGTIAARATIQKLELTSKIQSILAMAVAQAMELRCERDPGYQPAPWTEAVATQVRTVSAAVERDRPLGADIEAVAKLIFDIDPPQAA